MYSILIVTHVLVAIVLIALVLIQHGKGAQTGATFGSGASQTVFGSQGSGGFLSRLTGYLAAVFFLLNLFLVYYLNKVNHEFAPDLAVIKTEAAAAPAGPATKAQAEHAQDVPDM